MNNEEKMFITIDAPVAMAVVACGERIQLVEGNRAYHKLFGFKDEQQGLDSAQEMLIYHKDWALYEETLRQTAHTHEMAECEVRIVGKEQVSHWVQVRCSFLEVRDEIPYVTIVCIDIHQKKTTEMELKLLSEQYHMMEEVTHEIPFDIDVVGWHMLYPKKIQELKDEKNSKQQYLPFSEAVKYIHPMDQEDFVNQMKEASAKVCTGTIDYRMNVNRKHAASRYAWFRTNYKSLAGDDERVIRIIGRTYNVDKDKALLEEVRRDPLTKLLNKIETQNEIESVLAASTNTHHALLLIDIDNFKNINDTFGHTFGDMVISDVANQLQEQFRKDDVVGRIGGDEFLVLMKDTTEERAADKAHHLCEMFAKDYNGEDVTRSISISVGISLAGKDGNDFQTLFEKADHAMYRAKKSGKSCYQIAHKSDVGPIRSSQKEIESRNMISQDDQEFVAFAAGLMSHAKNIDGSLNMLFKRIASRMNLDLVALFEMDTEHSEMRMTNFYGRQFDLYDKMPFPQDANLMQDLEVGNLKSFHAGFSENAVLKRMGEYSHMNLDNVNCTLVVGKYEYATECEGLIYFLSLDEKREMLLREMTLLQELMRMISIFVSLRYRMDESKAKLSHYQKLDQLTGLYNFDAFKEVVRDILKNPVQDKIYAIEYLDINNFGYMNENYGYQVGDNALKAFAADILQQSCFQAGCRLYSDFFVILIMDDNEEQMNHHVIHHHQRFTNMQNHRYPNSSLAIAAGIYVLDLEKIDIDLAVENANLAWKVVKDSKGQGIVFFDEKFRQERMNEQQVIGEFYEALYRDDFRMYLQPKFILGTSEIYGAEALARWQKPDGKILPPGVFIEPLERIGYITELDFYMYEELLKTMSKWKKQKRPMLVVSTNFSGRHFEGDGKNFLNRIFNITAKYDVEPKYIEIEITEGVMVKNISVLTECLDQLRERGFRTAIDDFGTGYSSLAVLTDIPADVVKMDKSFIDKGITGERRNLILQIGRLVQVAGKEIIFEGIETTDQEQFLAENGFTHGQGYLCNRPIKIAEFESLYLKKESTP